MVEAAQRKKVLRGGGRTYGLDSETAGERRFSPPTMPSPVLLGPSESPAHSEFQFLPPENRWAISKHLSSAGVLECISAELGTRQV